MYIKSGNAKKVFSAARRAETRRVKMERARAVIRRVRSALLLSSPLLSRVHEGESLSTSITYSSRCWEPKVPQLFFRAKSDGPTPAPPASSSAPPPPLHRGGPCELNGVVSYVPRLSRRAVSQSSLELTLRINLKSRVVQFSPLPPPPRDINPKYTSRPVTPIQIV